MADISKAIEETLQEHTYAYDGLKPKNYGMARCKCGVALKDSEDAYHHFNKTMFEAGMDFARKRLSCACN